MALIPHSHAERLAAQSTKRRRLLAWLRREIWTNPEIAADIMGITHRGAIKRTLASMQKDGLVTLDKIEIPFGSLPIIGITMDGQSAAAGTEREMVSKTYERGRIGLATIAHVLDLQRLKLACLRAGWKNWITPDANKYGASYKPDALAVMPDTTTVCIECERTLKTKKRYRVILANHLSALKKNTFQHVIYACQTPEKAHNVERLFRATPVLMVAGETINVGSKIDMHFSFVTYENLPTMSLKGSPAK